MTLLYQDPYFMQHQTGFHPETAERLVRTARYLDSLPWVAALGRGRITRAREELLLRTHSPTQIERARTLAAAGGGALDVDTRLSSASFDVALHAAGAAVSAVTHVVTESDPRAFCLVHPPGHHATQQQSMGFCIFNTIAIAAHYARDVLGLQRLLIVDFDVHHGNGTQAIFYEDPSVFFLSIHRYPFYPGTGSATETGQGAGLGSTLNVPIAWGTSRTHYREAFMGALERAARLSRPELILISAGFDAHREDPIGSLNLEDEDFVFMTQALCEVANTYACGRIVSCLEGGYNLTTLPALIAAHVAALRGEAP